MCVSMHIKLLVKIIDEIKKITIVGNIETAKNYIISHILKYLTINFKKL